ncbi:MAG: hypothetical protein ACOX6A_04245 [Atribacter sp.]
MLGAGAAGAVETAPGDDRRQDRCRQWASTSRFCLPRRWRRRRRC